MKSSKINKTNRMISLLVILQIAMLIVSYSACSSSQEDEEKAKKEAKEKELKKMLEDEKKYKIALIPFDYTFHVGKDKANDAVIRLAKVMLQRKRFKPSSMKEWMDENHRVKKAANIQEIIAKAKKSALEIDSFCHGRIFQSGRKYGLLLAVYPTKNGSPSYYYRSFVNFDRFDEILDDIVVEMEKRIFSNNKARFNRDIYIHKFNIKFYKNVDNSIIKLPYINIGGVSYQIDDNFFQELLLYNLHTMQLFRVWNSNMKNYILKKSISPKGMDDVIYVDIDISSTTSLLTARIHQKGHYIKVQHPFDSLELDDLFYALRVFGKQIVFQIIKTNEIRKVGTLHINKIDDNQVVYCNDYYLGSGNQMDLLFPVGPQNIKISNDSYKTYVSPFVENNRLYNLHQSFLLKLKK